VALRGGSCARDPPRISLGEAGPRSSRAIGWGGGSLQARIANADGSFKDPGTAVMINHLLESGRADPRGLIRNAVLRSRPTRPLPAFPAASTSRRAHPPQAGADRVNRSRCPGDSRFRAKVSEAALGASDGQLLRSHNWHPYFIEGTKTLASNCGNSSLSRSRQHLVPTGYGSNILGSSWLRRASRSGEVTGGRGSLPYRPRIARRSPPPGREAGIVRAVRASRPLRTGSPRRSRCESPSIARGAPLEGSVVAVGEEGNHAGSVSTRPVGCLSNPLPRPPAR